MPGLWIASEIRKSEEGRLIDLPPKNESLFDHLKIRNFIYYSRQQHLVESCTRHFSVGVPRSRRSRLQLEWGFSVIYVTQPKAFHLD